MTDEALNRTGAILNVMKDQYGNYVVQKALEVGGANRLLCLH